MGERVRWSDKAKDDLNNVVRDPDVISKLFDNAEITLHKVVEVTVDEGVDGRLMWHRGFTHDEEIKIHNGNLAEGPPPQAWDYSLYYYQGRGEKFTVLHVVSKEYIAKRYLELYRTGQLPYA